MAHHFKDESLTPPPDKPKTTVFSEFQIHAPSQRKKLFFGHVN
jgi:hypothetical protein